MTKIVPEVKHTPKQIFEMMLTQQLWAFDEEDFERMWTVFVNTFSEVLLHKDTDDFGGEMSASEFKKEVLDELQK